MLSRIFKLFAAALALCAGAAATAIGFDFCEKAVRLDPRSHRAEDPAAANALCASMGCTWRRGAVTTPDRTILRAWLFEPRVPNGAAVLLLHGIGDSRKGMLVFARMLLARGFAVLTPDSRGHGESGGASITYGVREARDVPLWADWLEREIHPARLYGLGESLGAAVLLQSLDYEPRLRALAVEGAFSSLAGIAYDRIAQYTGVDPRLRHAVFWPSITAALFYGRAKYGVWLSSASPERAVAASRVPVLLIADGRDSSVLPHHVVELSASNPASVAVWRVPGAIHTGAIGMYPSEFAERVGGWFETH